MKEVINMAKKGRSTVYNNITSEEKLKQVNQDNLDLIEQKLQFISINKICAFFGVGI